LFVGAQVAFASCLVLTSAAFVFSLGKLLAVDTGFDARGVTVLNVVPVSAQDTAPQPHSIALLRRVADLPGVSAAAGAAWPIFEGTGWSEAIVVPGKPPSDREEIFYRVSPGYFATLRTPLLEGREFDAHDNELAQPIPAVVNLAFSRKYFGSDSAVGREFHRPTRQGPVRYRVVGLAGDAKYGNLRRPAEPIVYVPMESDGAFSIYLRSRVDAASLARNVDRELSPQFRVQRAATLDSIVGETILREKMLAGLGGVFALFGLALAATGVFGVLSYTVARRTREIGVRTALGARRKDVLLLFARELGPPAGFGMLAGLGAGVAAVAVLRSLLFDIRPAEPSVLATAAAAFIAATCAVAAVPARRAASIDPATALRHE
jgi:predicted permease